MHRIVNIVLQTLFVNILQLLKNIHLMNLWLVVVFALNATLAFKRIDLTHSGILSRLLYHDLLTFLLFSLNQINFIIVNKLRSLRQLLPSDIEI